MPYTSYKEKLKKEFVDQAGSVFERVVAENETGEKLSLSQIEEQVGEIRFELTSKLIESKLKLEVKKQQGPAEKCQNCGREMRDKGKKKRKIITSQGEIEIERAYNHCAHCQQGIFPPGPTIEGYATRLE